MPATSYANTTLTVDQPTNTVNSTTITSSTSISWQVGSSGTAPMTVYTGLDPPSSSTTSTSGSLTADATGLAGASAGSSGNAAVSLNVALWQLGFGLIVAHLILLA
ncbi:hypothetical protein FRC01_008412 [Tulasnella sp. 417]|nr:hypothetical protein FRC01_008412 [Tulasnella sp. 417]